MVQPIDLRLKDNSNAQEYFAQMKQQQNFNDSAKIQKKENQVQQEIENEIIHNIEKELANLKNKEVNSKSQNRIGMDEINDVLNGIHNMDSVFFQFELVENKDEISDIMKKELILKVIDKETKEVLRQYPTDTSIKIAKLLDKLIGRGQVADATV
jgi:DNA-directed RNA polymerase beta' subunit